MQPMQRVNVDVNASMLVELDRAAQGRDGNRTSLERITAYTACVGMPTATFTINAMSDEPQHPASFEISLQELERLVKELERGDLPLEKSLEVFERGVKLSNECRKQLEAAETRVEMLIKRGGETVAVPFDPEKPQA